MRVFLDTNVLASAFATRGLCADFLRHVLAEHDLIIGEVVLHELRAVLREKLKVPASTVHEIEQLLREQQVIPRPAEPHSLPVRDTSDRWILASAIAGKADVLVTGDSDLLDVASKAPLLLMSPRGFWEMLRRGPGAEE